MGFLRISLFCLYCKSKQTWWPFWVKFTLDKIKNLWIGFAFSVNFIYLGLSQLFFAWTDPTASCLAFIIVRVSNRFLMTDSAGIRGQILLPEKQLLYERAIVNLIIFTCVMFKNSVHVLNGYLGTWVSMTTPHLAIPLKKSNLERYPLSPRSKNRIFLKRKASMLVFDEALYWIFWISSA